MRALRAGRSALVPRYDFTAHLLEHLSYQLRIHRTAAWRLAGP